jgi:uncharacterized protein
MLKTSIDSVATDKRKEMSKALRTLVPGVSPLDYLLKLYEENYQLLSQLLGSLRDYSSAQLSHVPGKPPLWLEIIEQQPYTSIVRLTHSFNVAPGSQISAQTGAHTLELDPNAFVRVYHDSKQAEVTHCYVGAHVKRLFSLDVPLHEVNQKRVRMTVFFNKWLRYLLESGHCASSFAPVDALPKSPGAPIRFAPIMQSLNESNS